MSKIEKVCSTCKHEPRDENCLGCTFDWKNADGNTHWEPREPFINNPFVSEQACREDKMKVLSKIRAEIENDWQLKEFPSSPFSCGLRRAIEIIDKYMGESEDK